MTGLRISDILKLQWSDFEVEPDQDYYIRICTEKTETEATLPISHEALELYGEWGKGLVFKELIPAMTHHPLKQGIAAEWMYHPYHFEMYHMPQLNQCQLKAASGGLL